MSAYQKISPESCSLIVPHRDDKNSTRHYRQDAGAAESAVMDCWDAGITRIVKISAHTGINPRRVRGILEYMRLGDADLAFSPRKLAKSSEALVAAIARAHPDRVSGQ